MTLTLEEIDQVVQEFDKESKALKHEIFKLAWWMRGAVSIEEAYMMDVADRRIVIDIIQENLETSKETGVNLI